LGALAGAGGGVGVVDMPRLEPAAESSVSIFRMMIPYKVFAERVLPVDVKTMFDPPESVAIEIVPTHVFVTANVLTSQT
jgi:hypothetical protein